MNLTGIQFLSSLVKPVTSHLTSSIVFSIANLITIVKWHIYTCQIAHDHIHSFAHISTSKTLRASYDLEHQWVATETVKGFGSKEMEDLNLGLILSSMSSLTQPVEGTRRFIGVGALYSVPQSTIPGETDGSSSRVNPTIIQ